ncbi:MAG: helix-turn-helix transcriptional regulator [Clostridia bacterium]|nr:helix-turn-helix transcriptional regulator [Clostridia bacterium]
MKHIEDEAEFLNQIMQLISLQFGSKCEVVLHDLTKDYAHTIADIRNGHITNRKVGDCGSNLGLEVLRGTVKDGDRFNYITTTTDGKILKSSSIYLKDDEGNVIGSLCVNYDITETVRFEGFLKQFNQYDLHQEEVFVDDVNGLLDYLILQAQQLIGKTPSEMNKNERIRFLSFLDAKGAFLITRSSEKICELLGISKFTFYNYLEAARTQRQEESESKANDNG